MAYKINSMKNKEVLVLGGLGAIGSNVVHKALELKANVTNYDCLLPNSGANLINIGDIKDQINDVRADVRDFDTLKEHIQNKDFIFNCVAQTSHIESMNDPLLDIDINCRGQINILEAVRQFNPNAKVIYTGTRGQHGSMIFKPVDENHPDNPTDIYSANKLVGENYHLIYHKVHDLKTTSIRLPNVFGPRAEITNPKHSIVNLLIGNALLDKTTTVFEPGLQTRDCCYVDDAIDALFLCAQKEESNGEVFLIGSGKEIAFVDLVKLIIDIAGKGEWKFVPWPETMKKIETGDFFINYDKINKKLGWEPKNTLEEGIQKTINFYEKRLEKYI